MGEGMEKGQGGWERVMEGTKEMGDGDATHYSRSVRWD